MSHLSSILLLGMLVAMPASAGPNDTRVVVESTKDRNAAVTETCDSSVGWCAFLAWLKVRTGA